MKINDSSLGRLELISFLGLALSLPLHEASKNIFLVLCLVLFLCRALFLKETLNKSELSKYFIAFLLLSVIASLGAVYKGYEVKKLHDIFRYTMIGYIFVRTPLSNKNIYLIFSALIASALATSLYSYAQILSGTDNSFTLASVGHINHSSIYLLLIVGMMIPFFMNNFHLLRGKASKILFYLATLLLIFMLLYTDSRATFIGLWIILAIVLVADCFACKKINFATSSLVSAIFFYCLISPPGTVNEFMNTYKKGLDQSVLSLARPALSHESSLSHADTSVSENTPALSQKIYVLSAREKIWYTSFYIWKKEPVFGVGFGNFKVITPEKMDELYSGESNKPDQNLMFYTSHAHNRFVNTLVEGGLLGLLGLLILVVGVGGLLRRNVKYISSRTDTNNAVFWVIGANSLIVVTVIGLFNTTLHHEHGILAMILIAVSCRSFTKSNHSAKKL